MRLALIGIGKIANYQMQAIAHTKGIKLVDAHDLDPNRAEELPGSVRFHQNLDDLLKKSTADAFLVSTPTNSHFEVAMKVIEAGRIPIVEKPLCTSEEQMKQLMSAARAKNVPLFTAFHPACGREVDWWLEQRDLRNFDLGNLVGFESCFADPFIVDGKPTLNAVGKAGAWLDSGISILSIIARFIDPREQKLVDGRMTVMPALNCAQVQGLGIFRFRTEGRAGYGLVDTNWTLGKSCKTSRLWYEGGVVELDHAKEFGRLLLDEEKDLVFDLTTDRPRLVNHYCGVFSEVTAMFAQGTDNKSTSEILHNLLFAALVR